ncbi:MAG: disulfide bond formation protein B, partial [Alphaproteobacteria bacterium]|nr:disulfide bond formation protein B [Alphaproteobacteria bacterium]MBX9977315.1 disulfide bond formation protein B [Alphaproteobacteria bacterium]
MYIPQRFFSVCIFLALVGGYYAQYYLKITPCSYCLYQRYIFMTAIVFFAIKPLKKLGCLALIIGLCLSFYQLGLEHHYWSDLLQKCHSALPHFASSAQLKDFLKEAPVARCDQINWRILGISATLWTAAFQGVLIFLYCTARRYRGRF